MASASAIGPAAAASGTALTHPADVLRQRARPEVAVPATATADNEAKPTAAAATTAATTAARTEATTTAARTEATTEATTK